MIELRAAEYLSMDSTLNFFFYLIIVTTFSISANQLAKESCHKQLCAKNHHGERNVEIRRVCDQWSWSVVADSNEFDSSNDNHSNKTKQKHQRTQEAKYVHGLEAKAIQEP